MGRSKPEKHLTIKLRAYADTPRGKMLDYLRTHPDGVEALVLETISAALGCFKIVERIQKKEKERRPHRLLQMLPRFILLWY